MGGNDGAGETITAIETDTITTGGAVDFNLTCIGLETLCGVFSSDTALDGVTAGRDSVLCETELLEGSTSSNLDLSSYEIDTSNFLGDSVLNLTVSNY